MFERDFILFAYYRDHLDKCRDLTFNTIPPNQQYQTQNSRFSCNFFVCVHGRFPQISDKFAIINRMGTGSDVKKFDRVIDNKKNLRRHCYSRLCVVGKIFKQRSGVISVFFFSGRELLGGSILTFSLYISILLRSYYCAIIIHPSTNALFKCIACVAIE